MRTIKEIFLANAEVVNGRHVNGTDKQTNHNYGDAYESLFPDRDAVKLMMEVGVADGSCLSAWREIFSNATIVGMDIHHSDKAHGDRIEFYLGNQSVGQDCERAARGRGAPDRLFDVIIEDATHKLGYTLMTLFWLWPFVKPGGMYIVEEWEGAGGDKDRIRALFPQVEIVGTCGPHIQDEPLIVFRKPK